MKIRYSLLLLTIFGVMIIFVWGIFQCFSNKQYFYGVGLCLFLYLIMYAAGRKLSLLFFQLNLIKVLKTKTPPFSENEIKNHISTCSRAKISEPRLSTLTHAIIFNLVKAGYLKIEEDKYILNNNQ